MRSIIKHCTSCLALAAALAATLASCSKDEDPNRLPDGRYPIDLSTTIGQTQTRTAAGADDTKTIWTVGDRIGFFADGGYDNIPCTATATDGSGWNGLYWKSTNPLKDIKAYYPYNAAGYKENGYDTFTIEPDQSTEANYYKSDVLKGTASETSFNQSVALSFTHIMSKLSVELTTEDEQVVPLSDLTGATVQVTNMYTKGYFNGSYFYTAGNYNNTLTLYNRSTAGNARFQAIAVAGSYLNSNNQIIITSADGQRVYKGSFPESVQLVANKQYAYTFKVTKSLTVIVTPVASGGIGWEEGALTPSDPKEDTYTLYFPADRTDIQELKVNGDAVTGNSYQMKSGATDFTVTYQHVSGGAVPLSARFLPGLGLYKLERTYDSSTQTYTDTYKEAKSDIAVAWARDITEVGDYLYADGTWSVYYAADKTCVGIVFHVGIGPDDDANAYSETGLSSIHGYAVAVKQSTNGLTWFPNDQGITPPSTISYSEAAFNGYGNTKAVTGADGYSASNYPAIAYCVSYTSSVTVSNSSGWYLPSAAQLVSFYNQRGVINKSLSQVSEKVDIGNDYWSSTAQSIGSSSFYAYWSGTYRTVWGVNSCNIRPVITF